MIIRITFLLAIAGAIFSPGFVYSLAPRDSVDTYIQSQMDEVQNQFYYYNTDSLSLSYHPLKDLAIQQGRWHLILDLLTSEAQSKAYFHQYDQMYLLLDEAEKISELHQSALDSLDKTYTSRNAINFTKGMYYYSLGDYRMAVQGFNKMLTINTIHESIPVDYLYSVHSYLGSSYLKLLLVDKAFLHYNKALSLLDDMDDPYKDYYLSLNNLYLGNCKHAMAEYEDGNESLEDALSYYHQGLDILKSKEEGSFKNAILSVYKQLAKTHSTLGNYDSAEYFMAKSVSYHSEDDPKLIDTYMKYGDLFRDAENLNEALHYYQMSLDLSQKLYGSNPYRKEMPEFSQAEAYLLQGDVAAASSVINDGLEYLNNKERANLNINYKNLLEGLLLQGQVLTEKFKREKNTAHLSEALNAYQKGLKLIRQVDESITLSEYKQYFKAHIQRFYAAAIEATYLAVENKIDTEDNIRKLYSLVESNKNSILREAINNTMTMQYLGIPDSVLIKESNLKAKIGYLKSQIYNNTDEEKRKSIHKELYDLSASFDTLVTQIERDYPRYHEMKYGRAPSKLEDLRSGLQGEELLLEYFWTDEALYCVAITKETIDVRKIALGSGLGETIGYLINFVRESPSTSGQNKEIKKFIAEAHELYQSLIRPFLQDGTKSLVIVPDGKLAYMPFEILLENNTDANQYATLPYLVRSYNIRSLFSSAMLKVESGETVRPQYDYLGFAPSYGSDVGIGRASGSPNPTFLKYNQDEVKGAAEYFKSKVYLNKEATAGNFLKHGSEGSILHLAMHAFTNDEDPSYSGLIFSSADSVEDERNRLLYLYEIYNTRLRSNLVVLSGCETGTGRYAKGEGIISLGRAFRYAGCPNIVMSHWQVNDKATASIMQDFFSGLDSQKSKDQALRDAKLAFLDNPKNKYLAHPYYWSAFILMGDDQPIEPSSNFSWLIYLLAGTLLISVILILTKLRKEKSI